MKKILSLLIVFFTFISCNEDDGINITGGEVILPDNSIKKLEITHYMAADVTGYNTVLFKDGRWQIDTSYNKDRKVLGYTKWTYDEQNFDLLAKIERFDSLGVVIPESIRNFKYDAQRRIDTIVKHNAIISFEYNQFLTITKKEGNTTTEFSLNNTAFINSFTKDNTTVTLDLEGDLIKKITQVDTADPSLNFEKTFSYNSAIPPKGFNYKTIYTKTFGSSNNAFIASENIDELPLIYASNYLVFDRTNTTTTNTEIQTSFMFDNQSLPIRWETFTNGSNTAVTKAFY